MLGSLINDFTRKEKAMKGHLDFVLCHCCLQALRLGPFHLAIPAAQRLPHTLTACRAAMRCQHHLSRS